MSTEKMTAEERLSRYQKYQPTPLKHVLSWMGIAVWLTLQVEMLSEPPGRETLGLFIASFMALVPSVFWMAWNQRDKKIIKAWLVKQEERDQLESLLDGHEQHLLGERSPAPVLPKRRWGLVGAVVFALLMIGSLIAA